MDCARPVYGFASEQTASTYSKLLTLRQRMLRRVSRLLWSRGRRSEQCRSVNDRAWWKRERKRKRVRIGLGDVYRDSLGKCVA
jgi:hypothetical protein